MFKLNSILCDEASAFEEEKTEAKRSEKGIVTEMRKK